MFSVKKNFIYLYLNLMLTNLLAVADIEKNVYICIHIHTYIVNYSTECMH